MKRWSKKAHNAIATVVSSITLLALSGPTSLACSPLALTGETINIGGESAVIVWNRASQTEHFIRSVTFNSTGNAFGFVVPTPTVPTITAVNPKAFLYIKENILPHDVIHYSQSPPTDMGAPETAAGPPSVEVVAQQTVDGADITTVLALDTSSLKTWMTANGFGWTDDMAAWLEPYIQKNWVVTLFKYQKKNSGADPVSNSLLDLSFHTAVPFFPYSEPASQRLPGAYAPDRTLTVYVFSDSEMHGSMPPNDQKVQWPGQLLYADRVGSNALGGLLPLTNLHPWDFPSSPWLTVLQDTPRPGVADVYFTANPQQIPTSVADLQNKIDAPYF